MFENIFETVNSGFAQALYEDFLKDPASVPPEWRALFENGLRGVQPATAAAQTPQNTVPQRRGNSTPNIEAVIKLKKLNTPGRNKKLHTARTSFLAATKFCFRI